MKRCAICDKPSGIFEYCVVHKRSRDSATQLPDGNVGASQLAPEPNTGPPPQWLAIALAPLCATQSARQHGPLIDAYPQYATCNCPDCRKMHGVSETEYFRCRGCGVRYRGSNPELCAYCLLPDLEGCGDCGARNVATLTWRDPEGDMHTSCPDCVHKARVYYRAAG